MKTTFLTCAAFVSFILFTGISARAEDLRKLVSLSGYWRFSIGDDIKWIDFAYDDSKWDQLNVPGSWEQQGYDDYNGYAWYRKKFHIGDFPANVPVYLMMGKIDDADEVYLNGKLLGKSGKFPPNFLTAYDKLRRYIIPAGLLKPNSDNIVAVRVYDSYLTGGITDGPVGVFVDADNDYLSLNLSQGWKFHTGDMKDWRAPDFNDTGWKPINVPSEWENEGYDGYDGYAWYRLKFALPKNFNTNGLFLSLGKIDDIDEVYLNGKFIGSVYELRKDGEYRRAGWEYNARRIYKIPQGLLNPAGPNTIAIRVYDSQLRGGIYEGPIGLMSSDNCRRYREKHYSNQSFWDYIGSFFEN
jgi:hypothetical protein